MKNIPWIILFLLALTNQNLLAQRIVENANERWIFNYQEKPGKFIKGTPPYVLSEFDDSSWQSIALPHTWQTYETTGELHPYIGSPHPRDNNYWWKGAGIYRKHFTVPTTLRDKKLFLEFDGVMKNCLAYINGKLIGEHLGGYGGFYFDLTSYIHYDQENVFTLVVSNDQEDPQSVPPMDAGCWNFYGGIYRNARFVITDKIFIPYQGSFKHEGGTFITSHDVSDQSARLRIRTWVRNEYPTTQTVTLVTKILDKEGREVACLKNQQEIYPQETHTFEQSQIIPSPCLWSPASPNLYQAVSEVWCNNQQTDQYETVFGIREFRWDHQEHKLYVNGKHVNIQGFNRHQEYPWLGDALPYFIHRMDLLDIKYNLNCTALRPGQYISGPEVFHLADSLGLITFAELPNVKNRKFSPESQWMQTVEMVRKLRNSPSVLLWDMGDETDRAADSQWAYAESPYHYITCRHGEGSGGNYISIPCDELRMSKMLRCSVRGWYGNDEKALRPERQQSTSNDEFRHEVARDGKNDGTTNDRIDQPNLMVWLYEDHGCDREYQYAPLLHYNPKGWVDSYRIPKYSYYLWQANYKKEPMVYVQPHNWRAQYIGQKRPFVVDSNCDEVELFINGKSYGIKHPGKDNRFSVIFQDIPVKKGTLKVCGRRNGQEVTQCTLPMTGKASALTLTSSHSTLEARQDAIAILTVDIVDANGHHIYGARNTITWRIEGPAKLVGPQIYESDFDKEGAKTGTLYIDAPVANVIRSTGEPGTIKICVLADGLKTAEMTLKAIPAVRPRPVIQQYE